MRRTDKSRALVRGTLYMNILKTLSLEPMHLYGIGVRLGKIRGVHFGWVTAPCVPYSVAWSGTDSL